MYLPSAWPSMSTRYDLQARRGSNEGPDAWDDGKTWCLDLGVC